MMNQAAYLIWGLMNRVQNLASFVKMKKRNLLLLPCQPTLARWPREEELKCGYRPRGTSRWRTTSVIGIGYKHSRGEVELCRRPRGSRGRPIWPLRLTHGCRPGWPLGSGAGS